MLLAAACAALLLLAVGSAQASQACDQMRGWLQQGGGPASGLLVVDAESGEVVCAQRAGNASGRWPRT